MVDLFPLVLDISAGSLIAPALGRLNPVSGLKCYLVLPDSTCINVELIVIDPFVWSHLAVGLHIAFSNPAISFERAIGIQEVALFLVGNPPGRLYSIIVEKPLAALIKPAISADGLLIS